MPKAEPKDSELVLLVREREALQAKADAEHDRMKQARVHRDAAFEEAEKLVEKAKQLAQQAFEKVEELAFANLDPINKRSQVVLFDIKQRLGVRELKPILMPGDKVEATIR